jgi:thiol:disulfide interchange protein DsbD
MSQSWTLIAGDRAPAHARAARRLLAMLLVLTLSLVWSRPAAAHQAPGLDEPGAAGAAATEPEAVTLRATARDAAVKPGDEVVIAVELRHAPKFHTWPAAVTPLPEEVADFAIRTQIQLVGPDALIKGGVRVQWPEPKVDKVPNPVADGTLSVPLYSGNAVAFVAFTAPADPGAYAAELKVSYQACDESQCLMPEEKTLKVSVRVAPDAPQAAAGPLFAAYKRPSTPEPPSGSTPAPAGATGGSASADAAKNAAPALNGPAGGKGPGAPAPGPAGSPVIFGLSIGSSLLALAFFSAIGGMVLNLTPCVLPVIPIKVMTLTQHASSKHHALVLGLWMALGVVAFWTVAGIPMAVVSSKIDPSQYIFGTWWVTLTLGLLIALMGLGVMGLFSLNLPQAVYMVDAKADSPLGSFFFGVLAAVLGLPCFGFVAGGLLASAAALPPVAIMTIFVSLGVGMAAPYLVLSVWPQLLRFVPRAGPAGELVKQIMGLLLLAAAAFFLTSGIQGVIAEAPYLAGSMQWWAVGFFVLIAGVWLTIRAILISRSHWPRVVMPLIAVGMVGGVYMFAHNKLREDKRTYELRQAALQRAAPGTVPTGVWLEYTPELFAAVRKSGKPVFLDFTANWCVTCQVLKRTILDQDPTRLRLATSDVVLMEVDLSARGGPGWNQLKELGRTGIPTWVVYGPSSETPIVLDVTKPTHSTVQDGLERAGVLKGTAVTSTQPR